ncbi:MAG: aspartyl-tRNA(Asn)/glutamyl-tRNA(Gln) amidotransferase subunit [Patescibacteria group bacterium]|nr:aspartyl-tRNA(Asn)/glutamyl-tRNA(Gln) amidotransferase subunit [Patescibacteria group bacterium]
MMTIVEALARLERGEITAVELTQQALARIDEVDDKVAAVLTRLDDRALAAAAASDEKRKNGEALGRLEGIPFTAKDMFLVDGVRTTAASKMLDNFIAPFTATAIKKLEAEGAILIATVNQDEYAHGGSTEYSAYGPSKNPRDIGRVPGGSSGGSAAALAAGIGLFSVGTDTGGSIRQPAAYCGVVGVKPTYGLISRFGVVAMASSLDVIGPFAHTAEDAALLTDIMAGQDEMDATTIKSEKVVSDVVSPKRVGVVREYIQTLDADVRVRYDEVFAQLTKAGWELEEVSLPNLEFALPCYYVLTPSEISSNLERYDGIRYGSSTESAGDLEAMYSATRGKFFGPEVKRRILTGTYALSAGYYDAYYKKAMQLRTLVCQDFERAFSEFDILIGPTTPTEAFKFGEHSADPTEMYLADIMTVAANLAGIPAISLPIVGVSDMPLGLQIMAPQKGEAAMFGAARDAENILQVQLAEVKL